MSAADASPGNIEMGHSLAAFVEQFAGRQEGEQLGTAVLTLLPEFVCSLISIRMQFTGVSGLPRESYEITARITTIAAEFGAFHERLRAQLVRGATRACLSRICAGRVVVLGHIAVAAKLLFVSYH